MIRHEYTCMKVAGIDTMTWEACAYEMIVGMCGGQMQLVETPSCMEKWTENYHSKGLWMYDIGESI